MTQLRTPAQTGPSFAAHRRHPRLRRTGWNGSSLIAATVALISAACKDYTPNSGGGGTTVQPPVVMDTRVCHPGGNTAWMNSGGTVVTSTNTNTSGTTVTNPCPFVIRDVNGILDLGVVSTIPKAASNLVGIPLGRVNVFDVYRKTAITAAFTGRFATNDMLDPSSYRLELVTHDMRPGNYLNPANSTQMYDSIDVLIDNLNNGQAHGYRLMPGNIDPYKVSVSGYAQVVTGNEASYSARTGYPVSAYVYRWSVDGIRVSTGTSSTFSQGWDTPGTHVVKVTAYRNDGTADSASVLTKVVNCGGSVAC